MSTSIFFSTLPAFPFCIFGGDDTLPHLVECEVSVCKVSAAITCWQKSENFVGSIIIFTTCEAGPS